MNRRALVLALIMALLSVGLLLLYQRRFELEASGGEKVRLLIAVKPIDRGTPITDEMLSIREVPQAYVEDRALRSQEKAKILGLKLNNSLRAQQVIMWTDLVTQSDGRRELSQLVQPGNRAVTISVSRDHSRVNLIRPGDYVDVLSLLGVEPKVTSTILLQRVLVLAVGSSTSPLDIKRDDDNALTLSLSLKDAQRISLAAEKGRLAVALRNPDDSRTLERPPDVDPSMLAEPKKSPTTTTFVPASPPQPHSPLPLVKEDPREHAP